MGESPWGIGKAVRIGVLVLGLWVSHFGALEGSQDWCFGVRVMGESPWGTGEAVRIGVLVLGLWVSHLGALGRQAGLVFWC